MSCTEIQFAMVTVVLHVTDVTSGNICMYASTLVSSTSCSALKVLVILPCIMLEEARSKPV